MENNWRNSRSTIRERNQYMYNNSMFSDVQFSVVDTKGDTVTVPAHKYVLAISSPVFEVMFYSELAETGRTIDLPDCTAEGLLELFRYMYYDEVQLTGNHVMEVLYLAKKYLVPSLVKKCTQYLEKELGPEDVFNVLPQAEKLEDEKLKELCWKIVDCETQRAMTSDPFLEVTQDILCDILERETLTIPEIELFKAVDRWASQKIKGQEMKMNEYGKAKRLALGDQVVKNIRFPLMSLKEFAEYVIISGILDMEEVSELVRYYSSVIKSTHIFNNKPRKYDGFELVCKRFQFGDIVKPLKGMVWNCKGHVDSLIFTVDKPIHLTGVRMFGSECSQYTVDLRFYKVKCPSNLLYEIKAQFTSDKKMSDEYYGFTVTIEPPLLLEPDVKYEETSAIHGDNSFYGDGGCETLDCEKIRFHFFESDACTNGTSVKGGQFPELLFTL